MRQGPIGCIPDEAHYVGGEHLVLLVTFPNFYTVVQEFFCFRCWNPSGEERLSPCTCL